MMMSLRFLARSDVSLGASCCSRVSRESLRFTMRDSRASIRFVGFEVFGIDFTLKILLSGFHDSIDAIAEMLEHPVVRQFSTAFPDVLPTETHITAVGHALRRVCLDLR